MLNFTVLQVLADIIFLPETYAPVILTRKVRVFNLKTEHAFGQYADSCSGPEIESDDQAMGIAQPTYVLFVLILVFTSTLIIIRRDQ